jgi:alanine racemase
MGDVTGAPTTAPAPGPDVPHGPASGPVGDLHPDLQRGLDVGTGCAVVDLDAIAGNVASLVRRTGRPLLAVVKADAYGHGLVPAAHAALAGGATWLGVAQLDEALRLRDAGIDAPLLAWLLPVDREPVAAALRRQVTLGLSHDGQLDAVLDAARESGQVADVHIKVDTGLNRNGVPLPELPAFAARLAAAEQAGLVVVGGVFSHLAWADSPRHRTVDRQAGLFAEAVEVVRAAGLRPTWRHLANSAATLTRPDLHLDLVRPGLAVYGLSPVPDLAGPAELGLRPALQLHARLALTKAVPAGEGVSYGHAWTTTRDTVLGLVPLGYADGLPRAATGSAEVWVGGRDGRRVPVVGRICMDQVVVDLGPGAAERPGDEVVLLGGGDLGEPTAEDWARWAGTISYEIVARVGARLPRYTTGTGAVTLPDVDPPLLDLSTRPSDGALEEAELEQLLEEQLDDDGPDGSDDLDGSDDGGAVAGSADADVTRGGAMW